MADKNYSSDLRVINVGLKFFYDSLVSQNVKATQLQWRPPFKVNAEVANAQAAISAPDIKAKIDAANETAVNYVINSQPYWVDVKPAGEVVEGLDDYTIIHSGPPIEHEDMVMLHRRGLVSACLFEGWAKNEEEAMKLITSGKIKLLSALDTNTVGAGTGIITKSVAMIVTEDRATGKIAATFPAEGPNQGGFCGWGLYSKEIADYLRYMREDLLPVMSLKSVISMIKEIEKGDTVSYGCTFVADKKTRIATAPVGYADGFWRSNAQNGTQMLIHGQRVGIVGRVCMDQIMLDVTDVKGVKEGDYITLIGTDKDESITADELARRNGTIGYEMICSIGERVPRFYIKDHDIVFVKDNIVSYEISE